MPTTGVKCPLKRLVQEQAVADIVHIVDVCKLSRQIVPLAFQQVSSDDGGVGQQLVQQHAAQLAVSIALQRSQLLLERRRDFALPLRVRVPHIALKQRAKKWQDNAGKALLLLRQPLQLALQRRLCSTRGNASHVSASASVWLALLLSATRHTHLAGHLQRTPAATPCR